MRLATTAEMRSLEQAVFDSGISHDALMQVAGTAAAAALSEWLGEVRGRTVLFLVGPGNNGGDGLVVARIVAGRGARCTVYLVAARQDDPLVVAACAAGDGVAVHDGALDAGRRTLRRLVGRHEVLVDAVLGTGSRLPLTGAVGEVLRAVQATRRPAQRGVAIDLPTGTHTDTGQADPAAFRADLTIALGLAKVGTVLFPARALAGQLRVADIGLPLAGRGGAVSPVIELLTPQLARALLPPRPPDAHKGTFGKVLVVGGSRNYVGAPCLAAQAAGRAGAGLVTLATAESLHPLVAAKLTEVTFLPLPEDSPGVLGPSALGAALDAARGYDAVLVGPGLGTAPETRTFVGELTARLGHVSSDGCAPSVTLDADALNALAELDGWADRASGPWVMTPHPGEMARLCRLAVAEVQADRVGIARARAADWRQVVILKGAPTVVASPSGDVRLNPHVNPALASAGTGDVLAGTVAGLLAQGVEPFAAATLGVYLHGAAGELVRAATGDSGLLAGDLLPWLPQVQKELRESITPAEAAYSVHSL